MQDVRAAFRPEFLNRLDDVMLFDRLQPSQMGAIVDIQMARLECLLEARGMSLTLDKKARDWLAKKGYDAVYGARPLKRVIQREVQDAMAEQILAGHLSDDSEVRVSLKGDKIALSGQSDAQVMH